MVLWPLLRNWNRTGTVTDLGYHMTMTIEAIEVPVQCIPMASESVAVPLIRSPVASIGVKMWGTSIVCRWMVFERGHFQLETLVLETHLPGSTGCNAWDHQLHFQVATWDGSGYQLPTIPVVVMGDRYGFLCGT